MSTDEPDRENIAGAADADRPAGLLRTGLPHRAPPSAQLRRFRRALLVSLVVVFGGLALFGYVRARVLTEYRDPAAGFALRHERRFDRMGAANVFETVPTAPLGSAVFRDSVDPGFDQMGHYNEFAVFVLPAPRRGEADELAASLNDDLSSRLESNETVIRGYTPERLPAGDALHLTFGRRVADVRWRIEVYVFPRGERWYRLEFQGRADDWTAEWSHFEKVLDSFRITWQPRASAGS